MKKISILLIMLIMIVMQYAFDHERPVTKAELGKLLFFDPILSSNKKISCASCHKPDFAFADTSALSPGVKNRKGKRNTPTAMNVRLQRFFFWDGRAKNLEEQALAPIENPVEMNLPLDQAVQRLANSKTYRKYFEEAFKGPPTRENLARAIAAFERELETNDSPFDNWKFSDDPGAVSDAVKRGFKIFSEKGKCSHCHFGADFTANEFRNIGLFNGKELNDSGRAVISDKQEDIGKFRTSSLRNIAITAPYMHNGMFKTLDEVIEFYNDPGKRVPDAINRDTVLARPLGLTREEKEDIKEFLLSLTDRRFKKVRKTGSPEDRK